VVTRKWWLAAMAAVAVAIGAFGIPAVGAVGDARASVAANPEVHSAGAPAVSAATGARPAPSAGDPATVASWQAIAGRHPVAVGGMTTATALTMAEPDGTFQVTENAQPVRVRSGSGWVPVNTTLRASAGGLATTATTMPLTFGGGHSTVLATIRAGDGSLTLLWPRALPVPLVSGPMATYPGVYPGVDLRVTAEDSGFDEQLVVRSRSAAENPALHHIAFGVRTTGLAVHATPDGGLAVSDRQGNPVLLSQPAAMWDGSTHQAAVATTVTSQSITLSPDLTFLRAPSTAFPVTIDPDFNGRQTVWAKVFSGFPTDTYFNGGIDGDVAKVGDCYVPSGECNGLGVARTYFQYDVSGVHSLGGVVTHAEFNVTQTFGSACAQEPIELEATGSINNTTTWNTQPTGKVVGSLDTSCGAGDHGYNITAFWNNGPVTQTGVTFMLRAGDESNQSAWRKFTDNPGLIISYNRPPAKPFALSVDGHACATSSGTQFISPTVNGTGSTITLSATTTDPDNDAVKTTISWFNGATTLGSSQSAFLKSGTAYVLKIPAAALSDGEVINWRAQSTDGTAVGPATANCWFTLDKTGPTVSPSASASGYAVTPDTCTGAALGGVGVAGTFTFGPDGVPGGTSTSTNDIVTYKYGIDGLPPSTPVAASPEGGSATAVITPDRSGQVDLQVQSIDRAGNVSPVAAYCFNVGLGRQAVHYWPLDGATGQKAAPDVADTTATGKPALDATMIGLGAGGAWTTGRVGGAALFNGSLADYVQAAPGAAVDTSVSFSVSAWVRLDQLGDNPTAVSMDGVSAPGFQLQAEPDGHWAFVMMASDINGGGTNFRLSSKATIVVGQWTQLVATYDSVHGVMSLFVDGVASGTLAHSGAWAAKGPLTIGRSMLNGAPSNPFIGAVDDVRLFDFPLALTPAGGSDATPATVQNLANLPTQRDAWYSFEEGGTGSVATDGSGNFHPATLIGGADRVDPGDDSQGADALALDGATGFAKTAGPVVRTNAGFTVSAWVDFDNLATTTMTILSEDGANTSNFALQYRDDGGVPSFAIQVAGSDVAAPTETTVTGGGNAIALGSWTYVAATYNAAAGVLTLYAGTPGFVSPVGSASVTDSWAATGGLVIGRALTAGTPSQFFAGDIDNVQVFTGAESLPTVRAATPPDPRTAYSGELTRWTSQSSPVHITTNSGAAPDGYAFEGPAGALAPADASDTTELYQCLGGGGDEFTSSDAACGGNTVLGPIGPVFNNAIDTTNAVELIRCKFLVAGVTFHFDSISSTCEGQTFDAVLGYLRPLATLIRYVNPHTQQFWASGNAAQLPTGFVPQPDFGVPGEAAVVSATRIANTTDLMSCLGAAGQYLSTDVTCGGDTAIGDTGFIWTVAPPGPVPSAQMFTCADDITHQKFNTMSPTCEGRSSAPATVLGWVETSL
jgi:hypothetical protein